jgi:bidirectional [NiFe] hydrogenase diaphorase subunit
MPSYVSKPTPPNQDKRWKLVDATMRRQGQQARGLIETLHTVQEAFGYLDVPALRYVAMSLRVPLSRAYGVAHLLSFFYAQAGRRTHLRDLYGNRMLHQGRPAIAARRGTRLGYRCW